MTASPTTKWESMLDRQLELLRARSGINDFQLVNGYGKGGKRYVLAREQGDVQIQLSNHMSAIRMFEVLKITNQILNQMNNDDDGVWNNDGKW
jgi:hypothetical protein